jgi:prepilin-type N-terminal cleavage/methylation domain-containing protein
MSPNLDKRGPAKGFTLIEVTVSLLLLVIVLTLSLSLLFAMKSFMQRQQQFAEPRQVARRALDYLSSKIRQAADLNSKNGANNPNAIPTWYQLQGTATQACFNNYNNLPVSGLADVGTDVFCLAVPPPTSLTIPINRWTGNDLNAANAWIFYNAGCPPPYGPMAGGSDALDLQMFQQATGYDPSTGKSAVLTVYDDAGNWTYYQITNYQQCDCTGMSGNAQDIIYVVANPDQSDGINPPGGPGATLNPPAFFGGSVTYQTFRVLNSQLQQKTGFINNTDNPGAAFTPLLDNIEDMQVAWIFNDGTVWDDSPAHQLPTTGNIPSQQGVGGTTYDVTNVVGMRISITAVASTPVANQVFSRYFRPASEDRAAGANDKFYHYRLTATVMVRNRMLGG